jgi:hypothetical protein
MKVSEITGLRVDPRGDIEFDETERDRYVSRFLAAFDADVEEDEKARLVYAVHMEVCSQYDLYIAISDKLGSTLRRALHIYVSSLWKSC